MLPIRLCDLLLSAVVSFVLACALNAQSVERRVSWADREAKASWPVRIAAIDGCLYASGDNGFAFLCNLDSTWVDTGYQYLSKGTSIPVTGLTAGVYVLEYSESGIRSVVKLLVE